MESEKPLLFTSLVLAKLFSAESIRQAITFGAKHAGYSDVSQIEQTIGEAFKVVSGAPGSGAGPSGTPGAVGEEGKQAKKKNKEKKEKQIRAITSYSVFLHLFNQELQAQFKANPQLKPAKLEGEKGDSPLILAARGWAVMDPKDKQRFNDIYHSMFESSNLKQKEDGVKTDLPKTLAATALPSDQRSYIAALMTKTFKLALKLVAQLKLDALKAKGTNDAAVADSAGGDEDADADTVDEDEDESEDEDEDEEKEKAGTSSKISLAVVSPSPAKKSKKDKAVPSVVSTPVKASPVEASPSPPDTKERKKLKKEKKRKELEAAADDGASPKIKKRKHKEEHKNE